MMFRRSRITLPFYREERRAEKWSGPFKYHDSRDVSAVRVLGALLNHLQLEAQYHEFVTTTGGKRSEVRFVPVNGKDS